MYIMVTGFMGITSQGNQSYAVICHDAIRKYFRFDIKLDSDLYNEDIRMLRQIMSKHYRECAYLRIIEL